MNLILFEPSELAKPLPRADPRAEHILAVLRRRPGDTFDAGLVNGPLGKATLAGVTPDALTFSFAATCEPSPLPCVTLIVGLVRPQTARKILFEATTLGVDVIHFVATEKTDPNYAASTLWRSGEWRRHLVDAAQQAFDTRLPSVTWDRSLASALALEQADGRESVSVATLRIALDNYEASAGLHEVVAAGKHPRGAGEPSGDRRVLAVGPERGWGDCDRELLRGNGFTLAHLGARVLRVETAVVAGLAVMGVAGAARSAAWIAGNVTALPPAGVGCTPSAT
ncbi:MAG: RNA methyltransferase [Opitutaceae bacterium]|jgi:RsmE family RNA methyltransferase|nr:RNA methyltransferase [Opitutaceae bacterium]